MIAAGSLRLIAGFAIFATALGAPLALAETPPASCGDLVLTYSGNLECGAGEQSSAATGGIGITFGQGLDIVGQPVQINLPRLGQSNKESRPFRSGAPPPYLESPLDRYSISSNFGERFHPILGRLRMHSGVDMAAPAGTSVYAAANGFVVGSGWGGGYGLNVRLLHSGNVETRYGHLSALFVVEGQRVVAGQLIGKVGSTGLSTGPHLHYELRLNGVAVNPRYSNASFKHTGYSKNLARK